MATLKRPMSPSFENDDQPKRKRVKEHTDETAIVEKETTVSNKPNLTEELAQELQCGCCSALVYNPVVVLPCQHFFCGSCCVLWIRNGGTNCPTCRSISTVVSPFRALQTVVDTLIRSAPELARTERERQQADEEYKAGLSLRIPTPKEPSPEPNINANLDLAQPCPHCVAGNPHGWRCPQPIPDPVADPENAWHLEEGAPPGHTNCGHCENLLAIEAPRTSKCDLCQVRFCGINIPGRCQAVPLSLGHPHALGDVSDLIESAEVYDCFDNNSYEVEIMFDYLRTRNKTPRHIYRDIITHLSSQPRGLQALVESEAFSDVHTAVEGVPQGPYNRICRICAAEVLLWGLRDWWIRERQTGSFKDAAVLSRSDCAEGRECPRQKELTHAREYNHIIAPPLPETQGTQASTSSIPIVASHNDGPVPLIPSSSMDTVENMIMPAASQSQPHHRLSALSFLLNATEADDDADAFGRAIARRMRSPSPDLRDAIDALSS